jgi:ketosteroid isomerase-like protein
MSDSIVTLSRLFSQAFNAHDIAALSELTSPDFEFYPYMASLIERKVYRGHDGLRDYFNDAHAAWSEITVRQAEVREVGERTISFGELHGKGRASGLEVQLPMAWVGEWRAGKLLRLVAYTSKDEALDAAGLPESERGAG